MLTMRNPTMGRINVTVELANNADLVLAELGMLSPDKVRRVTVSGLVDTGATRLVLPPSVIGQLGLVVTGKTNVRYADHRNAERDVVSNVHLSLCGRSSLFSAVVEPARSEALIGAIVLEELDLIVDCTHNRVQPRDPNMIISEIE